MKKAGGISWWSNGLGWPKFIMLFLALCTLHFLVSCTPKVEKMDSKEWQKVRAFLKVEKDGKTGVVDWEGQVVVPMKYQEVSYDRAGFFKVEKLETGKAPWVKHVGLLDSAGKECLPMIYEAIHCLGQERIAVQQEGQVALINLANQVVAEGPYEAIKPFQNGVAPAKSEGKWGLIDREGTWVLEPAYDEVEPLPHGGYRVFHQTSGTEEEMDGEMVQFPTGKYGLVNAEGKVITEVIYDHIGSFSEGLTMGIKDSNLHIVATNGLVITTPELDIMGRFSEGLANAVMGGKLGFINSQGAWVIPAKYNRGGAFSEGLVRVEQKGKVGFIDRNGKVVVPIVFQNVGDFNEGLAWVARYEWRNVYRPVATIEERIEVINQPLWHRFDQETTNRVVAAYLEELAQLETMTEAAFKRHPQLEMRLTYGYINAKGEEVVACQYDGADDFENGIARVKLGPDMPAAFGERAVNALGEPVPVPGTLDKLGFGSFLLNTAGQKIHENPLRSHSCYKDGTIAAQDYTGWMAFDDNQQALFDEHFFDLRYWGEGYYTVTKWDNQAAQFVWKDGQIITQLPKGAKVVHRVHNRFLVRSGERKTEALTILQASGKRVVNLPYDQVEVLWPLHF